MDKDLFNELIDVLNQEARVYGSILNLSREKTRIIVEGKVSELENTVKLEQTLVLQLGRLEGLREDVLEKLAAGLEADPLALNVSSLLQKVDGKQAEQLARYQEDMSRTVKELKSSNELNSKLIKNSLDFIDFSMNMLAGSEQMGNNYGSTGTTSSGKKRSLLDIKL